MHCSSHRLSLSIDLSSVLVRTETRIDDESAVSITIRRQRVSKAWQSFCLNDSSFSTLGNTGRSLIRTIPLGLYYGVSRLNLPHDRAFIEISHRDEWMSISFLRPSASIHLPPSITTSLPPTRPGSHPIVMKSFSADLHFHHKAILYRLTGSFPQAPQAH